MNYYVVKVIEDTKDTVTPYDKMIKLSLKWAEGMVGVFSVFSSYDKAVEYLFAEKIIFGIEDAEKYISLIVIKPECYEQDIQ